MQGILRLRRDLAGSRRDDGGFTLIELMIVIAIIAIIAAISIPNLLSAKVNANETAARATLRNLVSTQAQVSVTGKIDADNDGKGEYGTFLEMSGAVGTRKGYVPGPPGTVDFSVKGTQLSPAPLSAAFSSVNGNGFATKSGYCFVILLPDASSPSDFVYETGPAASAGFAGGTGTVGVDASETVWCAYAQPMQWGGTGTRRLFTYHRGDILQSLNDTAKAQANFAPVQGNSAFLGAGITSAIAIGTRGGDGELWIIAN